MTLVENALGDIRAEWVEEPAPGEFPSNPAWNRFSDFVLSTPGASTDAQVSSLDDVVGTGDVVDHFRGAEEHSLSIEYLMQRFFLNVDGEEVDPIGYPLTHDYGAQYTSHSVVTRREATTGGNFGSGLRQYVVARGARPVAGTSPGDPSEADPIALEVEYEAEKVRTYVLHQPDTAISLTLSSTSTEDNFDVTIESEDATTTETVTLSGTSDVTTTETFSDVDAISLSQEPVGDISVTDGSGTEIVDGGIQGRESDGVEGDRGIPALGGGSHADPIGTDPATFQFLGTESEYGTGAVASRVHALDLSVELDTSREALQGRRRQRIDIGTRTVTVDADTAGEFDTHTQHQRHFRGTQRDLIYRYPTGEVAVKDATLTDVGDIEYEGDSANVITSQTFEGHGDPAVVVTHTGGN
jgi:hypothetical protein